MTEIDDYRSIWAYLRQAEFEQRYELIDGVRTRYAHAGAKENPALIMLHGTAGHWEAFAPNLKAHSEHFNCYAIDMVGCGFSDKPDHPYEIADYRKHVLDFMDHLGIRKASVVGVSLGAWVAASLARHNADRVENIILLSAAGYFSSKQNRDRIKSARTSAVDDPSWTNISAIFEKLMVNKDSKIDDLIANRQAIYKLPGMKKAMQNILVLQEPDIRQRNLLSDDDWRAINAPALVIGSLGDADEYLETARTVSQLMPNVTYHEMPEVGHWPQFEDPETFNRISLAFLISQRGSHN